LTGAAGAMRVFCVRNLWLAMLYRYFFEVARHSWQETLKKHETGQPWLLYLQLMINNHNLGEKAGL
jgi:hypothetical protein